MLFSYKSLPSLVLTLDATGVALVQTMDAMRAALAAGLVLLLDCSRA